MNKSSGDFTKRVDDLISRLNSIVEIDGDDDDVVNKEDDDFILSAENELDSQLNDAVLSLATDTDKIIK